MTTTTDETTKTTPTLDERAFLLDSAADFDRIFAAGIAGGLDAETILIELRVALTQSCRAAQRAATEREEAGADHAA